MRGLEKRTLKATFCSGSRASSSVADGCLITHATKDNALERPTKGTSNRLTQRSPSVPGGPTKLGTCPMASFK